MFHNISLQKKLIATLATVILINVASSAIIFLNFSNLSNTIEKATRSEDSTDSLMELRSMMYLMHQSIIAYVNTGGSEEKQYYEGHKADIATLFEESNKFISDLYPEMLGTFDETKAAFLQWENEIVAKQLEYMRSPNTVDLARLYEVSEKNKKIWTTISDNITKVTEVGAQVSDTNIRKQKTLISYTFTTTLVSTLVMLVFSLCALLYLIKVIVRPLKSLVCVTQALISKEWDVTIENADQENEIGEMARALIQFRDSGVENERLLEIQKKEEEKIIQRGRKIQDIVDSFKEKIEQTTTALENSTLNMKTTSYSMTKIAENTSRYSNDVTSSAQIAGENIRNVSAASEELTASINDISKQLNVTSKEALSARSAAEIAVSKMLTLEEAANEIGQVVQIIADIAEQTNLLALNATIESARAGEAGKGFAVVANEVKGLAGQTGKATEQIRAQVQAMQSETSSAVSMIKNISKVIDDLNTAASSIASAMDQQTSTTQEIARNVLEAESGANAVVNNIEELSKSAGTVKLSSDEVDRVANDLTQRSHILKEDIHSFIESIKAA